MKWVSLIAVILLTSCDRAAETEEVSFVENPADKLRHEILMISTDQLVAAIQVDALYKHAKYLPPNRTYRPVGSKPVKKEDYEAAVRMAREANIIIDRADQSLRGLGKIPATFSKCHGELVELQIILNRLKATYKLADHKGDLRVQIQKSYQELERNLSLFMDHHERLKLLMP